MVWLKFQQSLCMVLALLIVSVSTESRVCDFDVIVDDEDDSEIVATTKPIKPISENKAGHYEVLDVRTYNVKEEGTGTIALNCGKCLVHGVDVFVTASGSNCKGLTNELKISSLDCWWKNKCNLTYVPSILLHPYDGNFKKCFGELPGIIELGYSCFEQGIPVYDVIPTTQIVNSTNGYISTINDKSKLKHFYSSIRRFRIQVRKPENVPCDHFQVKILEEQSIRGNMWFLRGDGFCYVLENKTVSFPTLNGSYFNVDLHLASTTTIMQFKLYFEWCGDGKSLKDSSASTTYYMIKDIESTALKGIIRSHQHFPFNYPRPVGLPFRHIWSSFYHHVKAPNDSFRVLKLKINSLKIAKKDKISFTFNKSNGETVTRVGSNKNFSFYDCIDCIEMRINFTVLHSVPGFFPSDSGFLLFYEWSSKASKESLKEFNYIHKANMRQKPDLQVPTECRNVENTTKPPKNNNMTKGKNKKIIKKSTEKKSTEKKEKKEKNPKKKTKKKN